MLAAAAILCALLGAGEKPPPRAAAPAPARAGTVTGLLRHRGCQSPAAGATVSVIGRDATATSDAGGSFALSLPPGSYSLVIRGPNLVADQRVDDVSVAGGQLRELGVVEVWPEERPPGCSGEVAAKAAEPLVAVAPDTPSVDLPGDAVSPASPAPGQVLVRGPAGHGRGQFGLRGDPTREDEDALGPSTFAVGPNGSLWVLDVLNGRVARFDGRGQAAGGFPLSRIHGAEPVVEADMAVEEDEHVLVFTDGDSPALARYEPTGRLVVAGALPPSFQGVDLLFAGRPRPLFLMLNGQAVRADLGWGGVRPEGPLPGLPAGDLYVQLERVGRWRAAVKLVTAEGRVFRSVQLRSFVPVADVRMVGVNRRGEVVVAVDRAEEGEGDAPRAEVLLVAVTPQGRLSGVIAVPRGDRRFQFREFALAPDGAVVQLQSDVSEVRLVRWVPVPPPPGATAGEGLVRGRVLEGGRPLPGAAVTVGRSRRPLEVRPDGSFEVRLPAGTYLVTFRHPGAAAGERVERKVAVAAGATVDLGNVSLSAAPRAGGSARFREMR